MKPQDTRALAGQQPGDEAFTGAASIARQAADSLAAASAAPLYDPHTLWLVLEQATGIAAALKTVSEAVERKILRAEEAGLLVSSQPDIADAGEAAYSARDLLMGAAQAAEQLRSALSYAADATGIFAPRDAVKAGEDS